MKIIWYFTVLTKSDKYLNCMKLQSLGASTYSQVFKKILFLFFTNKKACNSLYAVFIIHVCGWILFHWLKGGRASMKFWRLRRSTSKKKKVLYYYKWRWKIYQWQRRWEDKIVQMPTSSVWSWNNFFPIKSFQIHYNTSLQLHNF